ncbi:hypothetical protein LguiA_005160 [Lonicera macranthoides]
MAFCFSKQCFGATYLLRNDGVPLGKTPQKLCGEPKQSNNQNRARWNDIGNIIMVSYNLGSFLPARSCFKNISELKAMVYNLMNMGMQ